MPHISFGSVARGLIPPLAGRRAWREDMRRGEITSKMERLFPWYLSNPTDGLPHYFLFKLTERGRQERSRESKIKKMKGAVGGELYVVRFALLTKQNLQWYIILQISVPEVDGNVLLSSGDSGYLTVVLTC